MCRQPAALDGQLFWQEAVNRGLNEAFSSRLSRIVVLHLRTIKLSGSKQNDRG